MKLLNKKEYYKLIEPLKLVSINTLMAKAVVEQKAPGKIFVDNTETPKTFYVLHSYGMSWLFGEYNNSEFNNLFKEYALNYNHIRDNYEWMQVFPDEWNNTLADLLGECLVKNTDNKRKTGIVELNTRVNFKFSYEKFSKRAKKIIENIEIIKTDADIFNNIPGTVVPKYYFHNEKDFIEHGVGFSLFYNKQLAATAFSSCIIDGKLEIGIETVEKFRGKGLAEKVCEAIIDYCITNKYEPVWSCRKENIGSYKLALKLGFETVMEIPYYRLSK